MHHARGPILITGGAGFVGRHLTRALRREHPDTRIVWFTRPEKNLAPEEGVELRAADLCDAGSIDRAMAAVRPSLVLHLAAQSSVAEADRAACATWRVNMIGSFNLADAMAREAPGAALVFAGSADVYGLAFNDGPANEDTFPRPTNVYARSKLAAEAMFSDVLPADAKFVAMRPTNHTGPGHDARFALPSFARQIARIERGLAEPVLSTGDLSVERDFLDVSDVVAAWLSVIERLDALPARAIYNVGSGDCVSLRALLDTMLARSTAAIETRRDPALTRASDTPRARVDSSRLRNATGWSPRRDAGEMTAGLLDYWRAETGSPAR